MVSLIAKILFKKPSLTGRPTTLEQKKSIQLRFGPARPYFGWDFFFFRFQLY